MGRSGRAFARTRTEPFRNAAVVSSKHPDIEKAPHGRGLFCPDADAGSDFEADDDRAFVDDLAFFRQQDFDNLAGLG